MKNVSKPLTVLIVLTAIAALWLKYGQSAHVTVSGPVSISPNVWTLYRSSTPLDTHNRVNSLCILPSPGYDPAEPGKYGIIAPGGTAFLPQVRMRSEGGIDDVFEDTDYLIAEDGTWLCFHPRMDREKLHSPYVGVELHSPQPLLLERIRWHSSD